MTRGQARLDAPEQSVSRRPGTLLGRRLALLFMPALGVLGCCATPAAGADSQLVSATIYSSAGLRQDAVTLGSLQGDPQKCPLYSGPDIEEHGRQNTFPYQPPPATWALSTILRCLAPTAVQPSDVTAITIVDGNGSPQTASNSQLGPTDLTSPSDFANTAEVPVVASLGSSFQYIRPWRGGNDNNFSDQITQPSVSPVTIEVFEGPALKVTASASPTTVAPGQAVSLSTSVTPANAAGLSYSWNFDGAASNSSAAAPQVTFNQQRTYNVTVQVIDNAGGSGADTIPITVGTQTQTQTTPSQTQTQTTPSQTQTQTTPNRRGPGGNGPGGNGPGGTGNGRHGNQPSGNGNSNSNSNVHTTTTTTSTTATRSSSGASPTSGAGGTAPSSAAGGRNAGRGHTGGGPHSPSLLKSPPTTGTSSQTPLVTGRLVSDVIPLPAGASPLVHPVPASIAPAPAARRAIRASVIPILGGALTVVLLLSLGAARELRGRHNWRLLRLGR